MERRSLESALRALLRTTKESRALASAASRWAAPSGGARSSKALISRSRRDAITELAFLQAFLAWETFLEDTFLLYMLGHRKPKQRPVTRFVFPSSRKAALEFLIPEGGSYAKWTAAAHVSTRAEKCFRDGRPFAPILRGRQSLLEELSTVRNAIAHRSQNTVAKFEGVVRNRLGTLPPGLTVGGFLGTPVQKVSPAQSFLELYADGLESAAKAIVP